MPDWELPPKAKVYEALTAVADGRVRLTGPMSAEVASSARDRIYTVTWAADGVTFSANDNASYWRTYAGYPIVAVLLQTGRIDYDPAMAGLLAGMPWKRLNDEARRNYDRAVESALRSIEERGGDRDAVTAQVDAVYAQLAALGLRRGPRGAPARRPPQRGNAPATGTRDEQSTGAAFSRLKRPRQPMPDEVRQALADRGLVAAYAARPAYQQNDYLGWIARAGRPETRGRRLQQMLDELATGGIYMGMTW